MIGFLESLCCIYVYEGVTDNLGMFVFIFFPEISHFFIGTDQVLLGRAVGLKVEIKQVN